MCKILIFQGVFSVRKMGMFHQWSETWFPQGIGTISQLTGKIPLIFLANWGDYTSPIPPIKGTIETAIDSLPQKYPYHPWDERYIYLHGWLVFMVNVGIYTIHGCYGSWTVSYNAKYLFGVTSLFNFNTHGIPKKDFGYQFGDWFTIVSNETNSW